MAMHFSEKEREQLKNDKSEIYRKRTDETNKKEIAGLSGRGKWQQFVDYYLKITVAVVAAVCLLVVGIVQAVTRKPTCSLYIAIQHDVIAEEQIPFVEEAIEKYLKLDTKKEMVTIDISCTDQQLQTYFYAGTADILITDEKYFKEWGQAEYFYASEQSSKVDFYNDYEEKYKFRTSYVTGEDVLNNTTKDTTETQAGDSTEYTCGLYLTDSEKYRQIGGMLEKPVVGIATTSKHMAEAKKFVKYMMDNSREMVLESEEE